MLTFDLFSFQKGKRRKMMDIFVMIYPKICAAFEFWTLLLQIGYLISKSNVHSPWLVMAGVRLVNLLPDEMVSLGSSSNTSSKDTTYKNILTLYCLIIVNFYVYFFEDLCKKSEPFGTNFLAGYVKCSASDCILSNFSTGCRRAVKRTKCLWLVYRSRQPLTKYERQSEPIFQN